MNNDTKIGSLAGVRPPPRGSHRTSLGAIAVAVLIVLMAACAGGSSEPTSSPDGALKSYLSAMSDGRWNDAYALIIPGQRAHVAKAAFAKCNDSGPSIDITGIAVTGSKAVTDDLPAVGSRQGKALTTKFTAAFGSQPAVTDTNTFHAYRDGGKWYLSLEDYATWAKGDCP